MVPQSPRCSSALIFAATLLTILFASTMALAGTVTITPGTNIVSVVNSSPAGTTFVIAPGTYRLTAPIAPKTGDIFEGQTACAPPTTSCTAIISGAHLLTTFTHSGGYYSATGQTQQNTVYITTLQCLPAYPACMYPEDLYFDSVPLTHVTTLAQVVSGTFYFDYATATIYFYDNPAGHVVEASAIPAAFQSNANNVTIKDLTIEKFAAPISRGAIGINGNPVAGQGSTWIIQNNEIRLNHGDGIRYNYNFQILDNYIHTNGDLGIGGGQVTGGLVQGNEIAYNNYAQVEPFYGAGGIKINMATGFVLRNNNIHDNTGSGFHADTNNINTLAEGNTISRNTEQGLFNEISYAATFRNNVLIGNGYTHPNASDWLYAAAILSSTSQNVAAYCNTVQISAAGGNGIDIIEQTRDNLYTSSGNNFHHNTVFFEGASGWSGAANATTNPNFYTSNHLSNNEYHMPSVSRAAFPYEKLINTFPKFQSEGAEPGGTVDSNYLGAYPTVTITSPAESAQVASGTVAVKGTATGGPAVSKIEFYVDWVLQSSTGGTSPFTFDWNTAGVAAGSHIIAAMAYGTDGIRTCYATNVTVP
jgi:Right handed beta helix region/Bacterial Ig domain